MVGSMIVTGVWTGVGFSNLKNGRTPILIKKSWNRSGVGVWKSYSGQELPLYINKFPLQSEWKITTFPYTIWNKKNTIICS